MLFTNYAQSSYSSSDVHSHVCFNFELTYA